MKNKKSLGFYMRASRLDKEEISKLAHRLRCNDSEAIRRSVAFMLEATQTTQFPDPRKFRSLVIRRKAAA